MLVCVCVCGVDGMALSSSQHILLAVSLALCMCFLVPRMMGGGGDARRMTPDPRGGHPHKENAKSHMLHGGRSKADYIKSTMEQELKSEKLGGSRSMTFALMPLYAVGVAVFAAYKFAKMKSNDTIRSKTMGEEDKKAKETECQLLELERHLSQTEQMLNSILAQLDPLSNCVNTLASEQKDEIMSQLQSIRQLMKKSGMDKSGLRNPADQTCGNTLEDLIHSFETQQPVVDVESNSEELSSQPSHVTEESSLDASVDPCEDHVLSDGPDTSASPLSEGLRKRNV